MTGNPLGHVEVLGHGTDGHAGRQENKEGKVDLAQVLFRGQIHAGHEAGHTHEREHERAGKMMPLLRDKGDEADDEHKKDLYFIRLDGIKPWLK